MIDLYTNDELHTGNVLVVLVILLHRQMRSITNFFLANLSVADFCVGVFCVLPNLWTYLYAHWIFGQVSIELVFHNFKSAIIKMQPKILLERNQ
jgi:7 transmembrane receptor (rhodopsin family)